MCVLKRVRRITIGFLSLRYFVSRVDNRDPKRKMKRLMLKVMVMKRRRPAALWIWLPHKITTILRKLIRFGQQCGQCHFQEIMLVVALGLVVVLSVAEATVAPIILCQMKIIWLHRAIAFGKRIQSTVIGLGQVHRAAWVPQILP